MSSRAPRVLAGLALALVVVVVIAAAAGVAALRRSYPAVDGDARLLGLDAGAEVIRDENGIPHIYAETEHDLFFLQGYVTASDRLWQLEFLRRIGQARLSEIFGGATLETDKFVRTLGWYRVARLEAAAASPQTRAALEAYAAGVNKYAENHRDSPPLEFVILGVRWRPWEPADSVVIGKIMAWDLSGNWDTELVRANVAARLGDGALRTLYPDLPPSTPPILAARSGPLARVPGAEQLRALLGEGFDREGIGSNNWVVSGARSASGKPLLANDTHLGVQNPSIWYLAHLSGAGLEVAGFSIPGAPGIVVGRNERIAWGVTNLGPDVQDLYVEQADPNDPRRFRFGDVFEPAVVFRETIEVKGEPDVVLEVMETRHGPVITPVTENVRETLALRWTALEPGHLLDTLYRLDRASSWQEFRAALRDWDVPGQNFVYADVDGHIGYQATGRIPIRAGPCAPGCPASSAVPVPGWDGRHEWTGYIPFDELPSVLDPPGGLIVTANQRPTEVSRYRFGEDFDPGFRAQRIRQLLFEKDTLEAADLARIQVDVTDLSAAHFLSFLLAVRPASDLSATAQEILRRWDGRVAAAQAAPTIYWSWRLHMLERTFKDKLGDDLYGQFLGAGADRALYEMVRTPAHGWFVELANPIHRGRDDLAARALEDAVAELSEKLGPDPTTWLWGKVHTVTFDHPLGAVPPLERVFNLGPYAADGGPYTVLQARFDPRKPYAETLHPSMRMVADLADLDATRVVYPTGQSGQPFAPHWGDLTRKYLAGELVPLRFSKDKLGVLEGTLIFKPR